EKEEKK
ncbi:hypothetical protein CFC21_004908, partial [Triticum aestivum]